MLTTIRAHIDNSGGAFKSFEILKIDKIKNKRLWKRYQHRKNEIKEENHSHENERLLFHGSPFLSSIIEKGFDERHAYIGGMFGAGIYFAENSSKSNQYFYENNKLYGKVKVILYVRFDYIIMVVCCCFYLKKNENKCFAILSFIKLSYFDHLKNQILLNNFFQNTVRK